MTRVMLDEAADTDSLPLRGGCWVAQGAGTGMRIAKVKSCYRMDGAVYLDLYMHDQKGNNLGRVSPVEGGPRSFEPACELDGWKRISEPSFPLSYIWLDNGNGTKSPGLGGVKVIPFGNYARRKRRVAAPLKCSDFDPHLEAATRRMSAQELRDTARSCGWRSSAGPSGASRAA
jgi:hypothetical protein